MSIHGDVIELMLVERSLESKITNDTFLLHWFRSGLLVRTVILLEKHGKSNADQEIIAMREMRNAVAHNNCDLSLNRNGNSLQIVQDYLSDLGSNRIINANLNNSPMPAYFSLCGTIISFDASQIHEHLRYIILKHIP